MANTNTGEGISRETLIEDPRLVHRRTELIESSACKLANLSMIDFDSDAKTFIIKDIGRIAAKYYIRHQSIEIFRMLFRAQMTEADILGMLSKSTEVCHFSTDVQIATLVVVPSQFDQIQTRESETKELEQLMKSIPCEVRVSRYACQMFKCFNGSTGGH